MQLSILNTQHNGTVYYINNVHVYLVNIIIIIKYIQSVTMSLVSNHTHLSAIME